MNVNFSLVSLFSNVLQPKLELLKIGQKCNFSHLVSSCNLIWKPVNDAAAREGFKNKRSSSIYQYKMEGGGFQNWIHLNSGWIKLYTFIYFLSLSPSKIISIWSPYHFHIFPSNWSLDHLTRGQKPLRKIIFYSICLRPHCCYY